MSSVAPLLSADLLAEQVRSATITLAYDRCARSLYRYFAVRVGDSHLADDLMQQLWLQALQADVPLAVGDAERWLYGIARNLVRTHWRRQRVRPGNVPLPDAEAAGALAERLMAADLAPAEIESAEVRDQLLLALTRLPHAEQELLVQYYFRGAEQSALAERLGISARAVEGRLYRARQTLRDALQSLDD